MKTLGGQSLRLARAWAVLFGHLARELRLDDLADYLVARARERERQRRFSTALRRQGFTAAMREQLLQRQERLKEETARTIESARRSARRARRRHAK
jgi:hypothetical protein